MAIEAVAGVSLLGQAVVNRQHNPSADPVKNKFNICKFQNKLVCLETIILTFQLNFKNCMARIDLGIIKHRLTICIKNKIRIWITYQNIFKVSI